MMCPASRRKPTMRPTVWGLRSYTRGGYSMNVGGCSLAQVLGRASWKRIQQGKRPAFLPRLRFASYRLRPQGLTVQGVASRTSDLDFQQFADVPRLTLEDHDLI